MAGPVTERAPEFEAKLAAFVRDNRIAGAAAGVVHGDNLAWSGGAGVADMGTARPAAPDTLYRIASITKTFTGSAVMRLRDAGLLDLDDPAVQWLPELQGSGTPQTIGRVTIRRLLSHESGLSSEPPGADWTLSQPVYEGVVSRTLAMVAEIRTVIGPNRQWKYSNLGYQLLGEIIHRASGAEFPAYLRTEILEPLGMSATALEPLGEPLAARCAVGYNGRAFSDELTLAPAMPGVGAEGGLWSSVQDLATWLSFQLRAHGDNPVDSPVLSAATRREMHKPRYLKDESWTQAAGVSWSAQRTADVTWVQHSGGLPGFSSNACFDPKEGVGAVVLVNGSADAAALAMELAGIGRQAAVASKPALRRLAPTPDRYKALLGLYAPADMTWLLRLEWRDGELTFVDPGYPEGQLRLEPNGESADTFTVGPGVRQSGETVRFRLQDGQVTSVFIGSMTMLRLGPVPVG